MIPKKTIKPRVKRNDSRHSIEHLFNPKIESEPTSYFRGSWCHAPKGGAWRIIIAALTLLGLGIALGAQAQEGTLCDLGRGDWIICPKGTVCDPRRRMCSEPVKPKPGYQICPDGLTTCPNNLVCNMEATDGQRCIAPGSIRCDLRGGPMWCPPGTVCDQRLNKCSEPVKPKPGYQVCPDGLTTCPNNLVCNMEATDGQRCIAPGSTRCDLRGGPMWCPPGTVCDQRLNKCSEPVKPKPGYQVCPDGLTTCPNNLVCNMEATDGQRCIAPGSIRCDLRGRPMWCPPGTVCDQRLNKCSEPVKPKPGYQVCPDGLSACPNNLVCNMEATDGQRCIAPGSIRCDLRGGPMWCPPGTVCDQRLNKCSEPVKPKPGYQVCPDGLTTCPNNLVCNMEATDGQRCIAPGSTRCDLRGGPMWCPPGTVCDQRLNSCVEQKITMRLEGPLKAKIGDTVGFTVEVDNSSILALKNRMPGTYGYYWYVNGKAQRNTAATLSFTIPQNYQYGAIKITARLIRARQGAQVDYLGLAEATLQITNPHKTHSLNINGMYKARDGLMCFQQSGNTVSGKYNWSGGGKIQGTLDGTTLKGTSQDSNLKNGYINYEFAADGSSYRHLWGGKPGPPWQDAGSSAKVADKCSF